MCSLHTFVKNHEGGEISPYLQRKKFTHQFHGCWWKKARLQGKEEGQIILTTVGTDLLHQNFMHQFPLPHVPQRQPEWV